MPVDHHGVAFGIGARVRDMATGAEFTVEGAHVVTTHPAHGTLASHVEVVGEARGALARGEGDGDNLVWGT